MSTPLPPEWPGQVHPPGSEGFERTAVGWLLDLCPPDYRAHDVLRAHPVVLARFARQHVEAAVQAARDGFRTVRADLKGIVPPDVVEGAIGVYEREGRKLALAARQVVLVEAALRGERWVPRL